MPLSQWVQDLENSSFATAIHGGAYTFAWIESVHVLAAVTVVGTILIVDLRLIGYASHRRGARRLMLDMLPFTWMAFAISVLSGATLFSSRATTYWVNGPYRAKMVVLLLAGINMAVFHLTAYRRIVDWDEQLPPPLAVRVLGGTSLTLWICVVCLGRWIGFTA